MCRVALLFAVLLGASCVAGAAPTSTIPIISVVDREPTAGVATVIGKVQKHPSNPLFVQDRPWEPRLDNGYPNVVYEPDTGVWRCWYGDCVKGCGSQILLYANSTDGLEWDKPELGMFDVAKVRPDLASLGTKNNIIMQGGGLGIYRDLHEQNASRRYKCFGQGCAGASGVAYSADGLSFYDPQSLKFPAPQRYDCHNQVYYSPTAKSYVLTTRDGFSGDPGRTIGMATSKPGAFEFDTSKAPVCVEQGDAAHQLYSQVTWEWHGIFLGIVMVYDATSAAGQVHCRLSWSPSADGLSGWQWVDGAGLTGGDFIPLGQQQAGGTNDFDSHICFAAASPVLVGGSDTDADSGVHRIYYMGGNGPHNGDRNSSFGLATLGKDRFAGLAGTGSFSTRNVTVRGDSLVVTADVEEGGSVSVGLLAQGLKPADAVAFKGSVTDAAVVFESGASLAPLQGQEVAVLVELDRATIYTIGFA